MKEDVKPLARGSVKMAHKRPMDRDRRKTLGPFGKALRGKCARPRYDRAHSVGYARSAFTRRKETRARPCDAKEKNENIAHKGDIP